MAIATAVLTSDHAAADFGDVSTASVAPTAGDVIYLILNSHDTGVGRAVESVTGLSGTWTKLGGGAYGTRRYHEVYRCKDWTGSGAITFDTDVNQGIGWSVWRVAGLDATTPDDNFAFTSGSGTSCSPTISGVDAGDATASALGMEENEALGQDAGWVELDDFGEGDGMRRLGGAWDVDGDTTPAWTWSTSAAHGCSTWVLNPAAGVPEAAPVDVAHAHTLDAVTVSADADPAPVDVAHGSTLDAVTVSADADPAPVDVAHGSTLDAPTVTAAAQVVPDDVAHGSTLDAVTVSADADPAPVDVAHGSTLDAVTVSADADPAPVDLGHDNTLDSPTVTSGAVADPVDLGHSHTLDIPTMLARGLAAPVDLDLAHTLDTVTVTTAFADVDDVAHAHTLASPVLTLAGVARPKPRRAFLWAHDYDGTRRGVIR